MDWWAAMTVVAIPSQPALSVDVTVCSSHQTVSVSDLGPLALFCTAETLLIASYLFWLENWLLAYFFEHIELLANLLDYFLQSHENNINHFATAIPSHLLCFLRIFVSLKHIPSIHFLASCLSMKSATHLL